MKCPTDNATLVMSERNGIEIDYCPDCRGVWLDRGELDKIIDRAGTLQPAASHPVSQQPASQQGLSQQAMSQQYPAGAQQSFGQQPYDNRGYDQRGGYAQQPYQKKRKENWLSELFD